MEAAAPPTETIKVAISGPEYAALAQAAEYDMRSLPQEARVLIREALKARRMDFTSAAVAAEEVA